MFLFYWMNQRGVSFLFACACLCAWLLPFTLLGAEQQPIALEDELKAVYIFNFIRFTDWPDSVSSASGQTIRLSVLGNHTLRKKLKKIASKQASHGVKLDVHLCAMPACAEQSDALFINESEGETLKKTLIILQDKPILTISDIPGFADQGGMIELKRQNKRVVFRINLQAIKKVDLYVSAQLLQLGEIVGEKP